MSIKTPFGDAPGIPVALTIIGAYLAWFGVHYWMSDVKWPTDPIKSALTGGTVPSGGADTNAMTAALQIHGNAAGGTTPTADNGTIGGTYNHTALMNLWETNGGSAATADLAAAISQAESSGNPQATSSNPDGGTNVGLWQLDTKGKGAGYTIQQLTDPTTNARVTILESANGTNWSAWETYVTGAYKKYLGTTV